MGCRPLIAAAALLAAGCQQDVDVRVTQDAAGVLLAVEPGPGVRACIDSVSVYPLKPDSAAPVWDAGRDRRVDQCVTEVRYGDASFGARTAAGPLQPGASYRAVLSGSGFNSAARFERAR